MESTTYRIVDAETETTIAHGMHRDAALDLLGMLMRWNAGVKIWMVQVDYCEEEYNRPQEEIDPLVKQVEKIKQRLGTINWADYRHPPRYTPLEDERAMVESVPNNSKDDDDYI